jgi:hypothetical protein
MDIVDAKIGTRPATLREVAERARAGQAFDPLLREFLDEFYLADDASKAPMIADRPMHGVGTVHDAYLGAVAEHLARRFNLSIPEWSDEPHRFLERPFFAGGLEDLKAILLVESPLAFRRRQIFVSANALSRPRDQRAASTAFPSDGGKTTG